MSRKISEGCDHGSEDGTVHNENRLKRTSSSAEAAPASYSNMVV